MKLTFAIAITALANCAPVATPSSDISPSGEMTSNSVQAASHANNDFEYDEGTQEEEEYEEVDNRVEEEEPRRARRTRKPLPPFKHGFDNTHEGFVHFGNSFGVGFEAGHGNSHKFRVFDEEKAGDEQL